jgi:hypothetical protein
MDELYINDVLIELENSSVSTTLQVNDLAELKDRQANYSNNIKIPITPNNIIALEMLGIIGSKSSIPYVKVVARYVVNGIELIKKGKGVVRKSSTFYSLVIYDGNNSMLDLMADKELQSLDWSSYDHSLTNSTMISSFTNTSGYIYCLGKFWDGSTAGQFATNVTSPSFYCHTLWDMIFADMGKTTSGTFLTSTEFKSRVLSMSTGYSRDLNDNFTTSYTSTHTTASDGIADDTGTSSVTTQYLFDTFTATEEKPYRILFSGNVEIIDGDNVRFVIKQGGIETASIPIENGDIFITRNMELSVSEVVNVYIESTSTLKTATNYFNTINPEFTTQIQKSFSFVTINLDELIGNTKRKDFIKDIMQRFGLMFREVGDNYEFIRIKDLLIDRDNAEDWTDKFSSIKNINYTPNYAQVNRFKYIYDDTDTVQDFADGEMLLDNYNLPISKTILTSIFKASNLEGATNILLHWKGQDVSPNDDGLRIFKINSSNENVKYKFNHDAISTLTFVGTHPVLSFSPLYYQGEINNYYLEVQSMFNRFKSYTLMMNLSLIDIVNIDFHKLKYIKQLGQYFYLNKISSFKNNKSTKVQLIQIGDLVVDPVAMTGTSYGSSTTEGTLEVLDSSSMEGISYGSSTDYAGLTVTSGTGVNSFDTSKVGESSSGGFCPIIDWTRYHDGSGAEPIVNDIIYNDAAGTALFNGASLWYAVNSSNSIEINSSGVVVTVTSCTKL